MRMWLKAIFISLILLTTSATAEELKKDYAYIISSINVKPSETIESGKEYSLVPQVVVYEEGKEYVGSVTPFTGCHGGKRYDNGEPVGNCLIGVINSLNSTSTTDALSAYQGKILNDKITDVTDRLLENFDTRSFYANNHGWYAIGEYKPVAYDYTIGNFYLFSRDGLYVVNFGSVPSDGNLILLNDRNYIYKIWGDYGSVGWKFESDKTVLYAKGYLHTTYTMLNLTWERTDKFVMYDEPIYDPNITAADLKIATD